MDSVKISDISGHCSDYTFNIKHSIILFILFLFSVSNIFIDEVLGKWFTGAVLNRNTTTYGVVLQGIFLVLAFTLLQYLDTANML